MAGRDLPSPDQVGCALRELQDRELGGWTIFRVKRDRRGWLWARRAASETGR